MSAGISKPVVSWCRDLAVADSAAALFVAEAGPSYISHGELQGGRALTQSHWAPDLRERVRASLLVAIANDPGRSGPHLATIVGANGLIGFALMAFAFETVRPYAVLDDLLIAGTARGQGIGAAVLDWLADECRARRLTRIFLESGLSNTTAHGFFERNGFETVSIVKMREL